MARLHHHYRLLLFNACLGFWQDLKASNALAALKKGLAPQATALRDGKWQDDQAAELWSRAISSGSGLASLFLPICRLIAGDYASIDQSALTGESLPVAKKIGDPRLFGQHRQGKAK